MSSRNARLSPHARRLAGQIYERMCEARQWAADGSAPTATAVCERLHAALEAVPVVDSVEYVVAEDATTGAQLSDAPLLPGRAALSVAVVVEGVRLIDNLRV